MDPELRKMLADAHTAGASDDDLHSLIDKWNADHVGRPLQDISPQLQQQVDARQAQAAAAPEPFGTRMAREAVNIGNGFPGFARASSAMIAHQRGIPYAQAVPIQQQMTAGFGTLHRMAGGIPAAVAMGGFLPANPALAGAALGAADQAAAPEPTSLPQRAMNTATGAIAGGAAGYLGGKAANAIGRAGGAVKANILSRFAPNADQATVGLGAVNDALSNQRYGNAANAAAPRAPTPAIQSVMQDPDIQQIAAKISDLPQYRGMQPTDPEFLTAVDQRLTDTRRQLEKGLLPADPSSPNTKNDLIKAASTIQQKLRAAMGTSTPTAPAYMPEYLEAVGQHAQGKGLESANALGYRAQIANNSPLSQKQLGDVSPAAIASESGTMTPQETGQLQTGVLSALKEQPGRRKMVLPSIESYRAAGLLRAAQGKTTTPQMSDYLRNLLMGTANSPFANP